MVEGLLAMPVSVASINPHGVPGAMYRPTEHTNTQRTNTHTQEDQTQPANDKKAGGEDECGCHEQQG